jgi:23S rRNA pseudouridine1911/1915/1917 synthase
MAASPRDSDDEPADDGDLMPADFVPAHKPLEEQVFIVGENEHGLRLDVFLAERMRDTSRSQLQRLISTRSVQVNGEPAKPSMRTNIGDLVLVEMPQTVPSHVEPQAIPLDILFEDSDILVLNKAKGMVVHPAPGAEDGTLVNALLAHCQDLSGIGGEERPGIVHRLDKDTSGVMMVAKNDVAHNSLTMQIQRRTASRRYLALVWGRPPFQEALIDAAIGRHPTDRKRMAVIEPGSAVAARPAQTDVTVREQLGPATLLECALRTGRTHQIRVHCAYAGYPVVGDPLYGGLRRVSADVVRGPQQAQLNELLATLRGQTLHAYKLSFDHPRTGERLTFEAPMPDEMTRLIDLLRAIRDGDSAGTE